MERYIYLFAYSTWEASATSACDACGLGRVGVKIGHVGGDGTIASAHRPESVRLVDIRILFNGFDMDLTWICGGGTVDAFCDARHVLDVSSTPYYYVVLLIYTTVT